MGNQIKITARKTNSSGPRALYGMGSRSRLKLENMFNVSSGMIAETADNKSDDDSKCNISDDDDH